MLGSDGRFNRMEDGVVLNDDHYRNMTQEAKRWGLEQRREQLEHHAPHEAMFGAEGEDKPRCSKCSCEHQPHELSSTGLCHLCEVLSRIPSPIPEVPRARCVHCGYMVPEKDIGDGGKCIWCHGLALRGDKP